MTLLLPAVFVSLVVYHPITIPMTLLTSIMQSRTNVPINLFEETLLMVAVFALINESAIRIPGMMGSSLGLVSTLILGTAAVDAGLVSPLLIIVVALSGLGSYAMPNYPLILRLSDGAGGAAAGGGHYGDFRPVLCRSDAVVLGGGHGEPGPALSGPGSPAVPITPICCFAPPPSDSACAPI